MLAQAQADAAAGKPLNKTAVSRIEANLAFTWQNDHKAYPTAPVGDARAVSAAMYAKYSPRFAPYCPAAGDV